MTDNNIIKALGFCMEGTGRTNCENCPLTNEYCRTELPRLALDLINRQKAEIERVNKETVHFYKKMEYIFKTHEETKSEAIKEFAERLKEKKCVLYDESPYGDYYDSISAVCIGDIDNLVKEMVGENK